MLAHVQPSRQEPGCLLHSIHRDVENELRVLFIEQWEDAESLDAHFNVPASGEFVREAAALALRPPEMSIFEASWAEPSRGALPYKIPTTVRESVAGSERALRECAGQVGWSRLG